MYSANQPECAVELPAQIRAAGAPIVARVRVTENTTDFAIAVSPLEMAVVRQTVCARAIDNSALGLMVAAGDFVWAGLVYAEREGSDLSGPIECFHESEMDRLVERLRALKDAADDTH